MRPKVGHARNRSRTACFNERFLKQAILGSKQLAGEQVDNVTTTDRGATPGCCAAASVATTKVTNVVRTATTDD